MLFPWSVRCVKYYRVVSTQYELFTHKPLITLTGRSTRPTDVLYSEFSLDLCLLNAKGTMPKYLTVFLQF